jgi:hypothetical protein
MIKLDDPLYFSNIRLDYRNQSKFWNRIHAISGDGGKFYIDVAKKILQNRFVSRNGEWSTPWKQELIPGFEMPEYNPSFNKSYEQVTDERAHEIKIKIQKGDKFAVMYSGGMDSTLVLVSLLKNLTKEELESVAICASVHSMIENPILWEKHIQGKFKIFDSTKHTYDDYIHMGYRPITADEGDCIFGTSIGLQLYHNFDYYVSELSVETQAKLLPLRYKISSADIHYTVFQDIIARHLAYDTTPEGLKFGRLLYQKYHRNIQTASVPVHSLHDFFWWLIFNVKYLNCSVRGAIYFNHSIPIRKCIDSIENWFNGGEYQQWSMVNNNNGEKIKNTLATYKYAQRRYIYDFDKNEWYFKYKTKLESLSNLLVKGKMKTKDKEIPGKLTVGLDLNYEPLHTKDHYVREYFKYHLSNYQIDWAD